MLKYRSCLLIAMSISRLHFLYVPSYIDHSTLDVVHDNIVFSIYDGTYKKCNLLIDIAISRHERYFNITP